MNNINKTILSVVFLLLTPLSHAAIINGSTNTEYQSGKFANLQGLEWLSLDMTKGQSRNSIESGYGNYLSKGWRYADRTETETLLGSLWGGTNGFSRNNFSGASWFLDNFSTTFQIGRVRASSFFYGNDGECSRSLSSTCLGGVAALNFGRFSAGAFHEFFGLDAGLSNFNVTVHKGSSLYGVGSSLLVRSSDVPEPSTLALMTAGLFGIGFVRRKNRKYK